MSLKKWFWLTASAAVLLGLILSLLTVPGLIRAVFFKGVELEHIPQTNIYVSPTLSEEQRANLLEFYLLADERVRELWGSTTALPVLLVGDTMGFLNRYGEGSTHAGMTYFTPLGSYIILDPSGTNVNVIAHELCHAELTERVGWRVRQKEVPTWFDEGLAMLVDERFPNWYDELLLMSRGGTDLPELDDLKTPRQFFNERGLLNYFVAKKLVKDWYTLKGAEGLKKLSQNLVSGSSFDEQFWR